MREHSLRFRLAAGVRFVRKAEGAFQLLFDSGNAIAVPASHHIQISLLASTSAQSEVDLTSEIANSATSIASFWRFFGLLERASAIEYLISPRSGGFIRIERLVDTFSVRERGISDHTAEFPDDLFVLRQHDHIVVQAPLAPTRVLIYGDECIRAAVALLIPASDQISGPDVAVEVRSAFASAGLYDRVPNSQREWEFHDRLFHSRTRMMGAMRIGRVDRAGDRGALGKSSAPSPSGLRYELDVPPIDNNLADADFLAVLERRRSERNFSGAKMAYAQLSELCYWSMSTGWSGVINATLVRRKPYAAAGALHDLEVSLIVTSCEGIPDGFYRYDGEQHCLICRLAPECRIEEAINTCQAALGGIAAPPNVLFIVTTRQSEVRRSYRGIAYRLSLMTAGGLIQVIQLVAVYMGLAASPVGWGDSGWFAEVTGSDVSEETSIAEIAVGVGS